MPATCRPVRCYNSWRRGGRLEKPESQTVISWTRPIGGRSCPLGPPCSAGRVRPSGSSLNGYEQQFAAAVLLASSLAFFACCPRKGEFFLQARRGWTALQSCWAGLRCMVCRKSCRPQWQQIGIYQFREAQGRSSVRLTWQDYTRGRVRHHAWWALFGRLLFERKWLWLRLFTATVGFTGPDLGEKLMMVIEVTAPLADNQWSITNGRTPIVDDQWPVTISR